MIVDEFEFLSQAVGGYAQVVFDVGAKNGRYTSQFLRIFPQARIYTVDCAPKAIEVLERDFGNNERVQIVPLAFDDVGLTLPFYVCQMSGSSSLHPITETFAQETCTTETIQVKTITLDEYCKQLCIPHVDLLKIDTEGHDLRVLRGARRMLEEHRISFVHVELLFFPYYQFQCWYYEVAGYLEEHGYALKAMWPTYWGGRIRYAQAFFEDQWT